MSNLKLVVQVVSARDLISRKGKGPVNAFVELQFDSQMHRTTVKEGDLNPCWNEHFFFTISDPSSLPWLTLKAHIFHADQATLSERSIGKVLLVGTSFVPCNEAAILFYPFEKNSVFSRVRGELGLMVFLTDEACSSSSVAVPDRQQQWSPSYHSAAPVSDPPETHRLEEVKSASKIYVGMSLGGGNRVFYEPTTSKLQEALRKVEYWRHKAHEETLWPQEAAMDAAIALMKDKESEGSEQDEYMKEVKRRKEIEQEIPRIKEKQEGLLEEIRRIKEEQDDISDQLQRANEKKLELELKIIDSGRTAKHLQEKLFKFRQLCCSLKGEYDIMKQERDAAVKEAEELRRLKKEEEALYTGTNWKFTLEFSYKELEQATQNFSNERKTGEGGFGTIYRGFLRNKAVTIKMLNPSRIQSQFEFHQEVAVLSSLRHPNLVTLRGSCSEAFALIYEFFPNQSLEDHLACKNNSAPLQWQVRTRIIAEIRSALIFLHSRKTPIIHGDLKPDSILLNFNFVSKLGDFGIWSLSKKPTTTTAPFHSTQPKDTFAYLDPEFMATGDISADVYSFGIIILRLVTGKPARDIVKYVQEALDNDYLHTMIDLSAGEWPFVQAKQLAEVGLKFCKMRRRNHPDLRVAEVWKAIEPVMKSAVTLSVSPQPSSRSSSSDDDENAVPSYFICPIFQDVMRDPQIAADGFSYEAEAIRSWIDRGHDTSPMTNLKLSNCDLIPNRPLRSAIQEMQQQRGGDHHV